MVKRDSPGKPLEFPVCIAVLETECIAILSVSQLCVREPLFELFRYVHLLAVPNPLLLNSVELRAGRRQRNALQGVCVDLEREAFAAVQRGRDIHLDECRVACHRECQEWADGDVGLDVRLDREFVPLTRASTSVAPDCSACTSRQTV